MLETKLFIFLCVFYTVQAKVQILLTDRPVEVIGQRLYKKEILTQEFNSPKELSYDSTTRNLYFMYMDDELQNSGRAFINVITKEAVKINGIQRNKATAVDPDTSDVYFGSDDGLYKYDAVTNKAYNIGLYNTNIMKIVLRNNEMYILDANNHNVYKVYDEGESTVKALNVNTVMQFDVDNSKNFHVVTMCGVYCGIAGGGVIKNKDLSAVYHFIVDAAKTYGVTEDGVYDIDCNNGTALKVATLNFVPNSIIFGDYGDILYSVDDSIYRLRPISYHIYNIRKRT